MQTRQTQVLQYFFLFYGLAAATAAAWLAATHGEALAWSALGALACCALPIFKLRDLALLRTMLSWCIGGMACLTVGVWVHGPASGWRFQASMLCVTLLALAVRDAVRDNPYPSESLTLFSPASAPPSLRSAYEEEIRQTAGQEERNRLARDLHDSIKQQIFAIQTSAAAVQARFDNDPAGARLALEGVRSSAREAMVEMEAMLDQLRASPLETVGLVEALKKQCEALQYRTGARVRVDVADIAPADQMRPGLAQALFRIAQEALANVARHARATNVRVSLGTVGGECVLSIEDDGSGFDPDGATRIGMGLTNMKMRALEMGGSLDQQSSPEKGTKVVATVPLAPPAEKPLEPKTVTAFLVLVGLTAAALLIAVVFKKDFPMGFALGTGIGGAALAVKLFLARRI